MEGELANSGNSFHMSRAGARARRFRLRVKGATSENIMVSDQDGKESSPRSLSAFLHTTIRASFVRRHPSQTNEGKVASAISYRARLTCLPTNATPKSWKPTANPKCRKCDHQLVSRPSPTSSTIVFPIWFVIQRRHDLVQDRFVSAIRHSEVIILMLFKFYWLGDSVMKFISRILTVIYVRYVLND